MCTRKKLITSGVSFLVVIGILTYGVYRYKQANFQQNSFPPTVVEAATVKETTWHDEITATGTLNANQGIMIKPDVAGQITKIFFKSGTYVNQGEPLIQIYPDILEAQLARNKAALRLAELDFKRYAALYQKGSIAKAQFDQASAKLAEDKAITAQTEAQLRQHTLTAPFSGQLGLRLVDLGDYVSPGQNIVSLQAIDPMRIEFAIPEVYLSLLAKDQTVDIRTVADPKTPLKGTVYAFDSIVNTTTRSLNTWAHVPNKDHQLIPGTFANLTLYAGKEKKTLVIPQSAVVYDSAGNYVFKIVNKIAKKTPITIGLRKQDTIAVLSGLAANDQVVTAGQLKLFDNSPVILTSELKKSANSTHSKQSQ